MSKTLKEITLTVFFTGGNSLQSWVDTGSFDREIELYKRLSKKLKKVNIVTYGGKKDIKYKNLLGNINLLPAVWYPVPQITLIPLFLTHYSKLKNSDIFKTNQIFGSEIAVWLKQIFHKKLITRCGYFYSYFMKNVYKDKGIIKKAIRIEKKAFQTADVGVITSEWQRYGLINLHNLNSEKIKVVPNYVITDLFKPIPQIEKKFDLIFIGRGDEQKNVMNLLKAIHYLKSEFGKEITGIFVGSCCYEKKVRDFINNRILNIDLKGNVGNSELPEILNQSRVFIIPSYYEGHPKTLLEAMSCELPCIGTNVIGIKQDIKHLETGYLCETDYKSIAEAIKIVLSNQILRRKLGESARKYICERYSLDRILPEELNLIKETMA